MKQKHYTDNTPSREVTDDWEETGIDEMNELAEKIHDQRSQSMHVVDIIDRVERLRDLVEVCRTSLLCTELSSKAVAAVLYDFVNHELETIGKELKQL